MAKDKKIQSKPAAAAEAVKPADVKPVVEVVKSAPEVKAPAAAKAAQPAVKKAEKPAEKKAEKPAAKKAAEAKKDVFVIQASGKEYTMSDITELCKAAYKDGTRKHVKSIDIYVKAENGEMRAYYVINGNGGNYIVL
ncbi:MAG: DUF6465 family protein [Oscillospiraceae bacterium]|nr:DUF6465 family protein [Oscillospiraceae bacterium]